MNNDYQRNGFVLLKGFFSDNEIEEAYSVVSEFHELWKKDNTKFYSERAVNSAYLTSEKYLSNELRERLFHFISSNKIIDSVKCASITNLAFMNTQLFFNPVNPNQKNYWHRDAQYHLDEDEQQKALSGPEVLHLRVPLFDEPGIELVPGTHKKWDTEEELDIRLERHGKRNFESLSTGLEIALEKGDLLIFSANLIHRGLYGKNRLALDILYCEAKPELFKFAAEDCMPSVEMLDSLDNALAFENSINLILKNS